MYRLTNTTDLIANPKTNDVDATNTHISSSERNIAATACSMMLIVVWRYSDNLNY